MMIFGPLLVAVLPGIFCILLTVLFRRRQWKLGIRLIPGSLLAAIALAMLWISVEIRSFEGAAYGILAFFFFIFSLVCVMIASNKSKPSVE